MQNGKHKAWNRLDKKKCQHPYLFAGAFSTNWARNPDRKDRKTPWALPKGHSARLSALAPAVTTPAHLSANSVSLPAVTPSVQAQHFPTKEVPQEKDNPAKTPILAPIPDQTITQPAVTSPDQAEHIPDPKKDKAARERRMAAYVGQFGFLGMRLPQPEAVPNFSLPCSSNSADPPCVPIAKKVNSKPRPSPVRPVQTARPRRTGAGSVKYNLTDTEEEDLDESEEEYKEESDSTDDDSEREEEHIPDKNSENKELGKIKTGVLRKDTSKYRHQYCPITDDEEEDNDENRQARRKIDKSSERKWVKS